MKKFVSALAALGLSVVVVPILAVVLRAMGLDIFTRHLFLTMLASGIVSYLWFRRSGSSENRGVERSAPSRPTTPRRPDPTTTFGGSFNPSRFDYGVPGGKIGGSGSGFGAANEGLGRKGEEKTAAMLDELRQRTGKQFYLFNGLLWPGTKQSDLDHVVAFKPVGQRPVLLVIDTKLWKSGAYHFDGTSTYRDGEHSHDIKFPAGVDALRRELGSCKVSGVIAIHGARSVTNAPGIPVPIIPGYSVADYVDSVIGTQQLEPLPTALGNQLIRQLK